MLNRWRLCVLITASGFGTERPRCWECHDGDVQNMPIFVNPDFGYVPIMAASDGDARDGGREMQILTRERLDRAATWSLRRDQALRDMCSGNRTTQR